MESMVMPQHLFSNIYFNKRVLITGHTGFKGSWLTLWLQKLGAQVIGYSLDVQSPSHFELLNPTCETILGDIRNAEKLEQVFSRFKPEIVFHLAAQSLVRESYRKPQLTYETNVIGTLNVIQAAHKCESVKALINITTDKVYENKEDGKPYQETDPLGGYDMYSSSKACADILASSYRNSFLQDTPLLLATARAGNVIGGGDWGRERLIPDLIRGVINSKKTEIRSPYAIRPWEHVLEPLSGYLLLGERLLEGNGKYASSWNFGPLSEQHKKVNEIVELMKSKWNKIHVEINEEEAKKFHEAGILKLDCCKATNELNWKPVWDIQTTIRHTIEWYKMYTEKNEVNSDSDIDAYVDEAQKKLLTWTL